MHIRYNEANDYFEFEATPGAGFAQLPLTADILTTGALAKARQHAQTAYKDEANVFTLTNQFSGDGIRLTHADPVVGITADGATNSNLRLRANGSILLHMDLDNNGVESILFRNGAGVDVLSIPEGGGLQFPATQIANAGANVLDDYEEGGWIPTAGFSISNGDLSGTYDFREGSYTKIGKLVRINFFIQVSNWAHTTASGDFILTGLPFAAESAGNNYHYGCMQYSGVTCAGFVDISARVADNASRIDFIANSIASGGAIQLTTAHVPSRNPIQFLGTIVYTATA